MTNEGYVCKFCGQMNFDGAECDCPGAVRERRIENQIAEAKNAIREMFGAARPYGEIIERESVESSKCEACIETLNIISESIAHDIFDSASVVFSDGTKAKLKIT